MNQQYIQSSVHPQELVDAIKQGMPLVILGIVIGLWGQEWLKPDPFSLVGISAFGATVVCLFFGLRPYIQLKLADRNPIFISLDGPALLIEGFQRQDIELPIQEISSCHFLDRTIVLELKNGERLTLKHFSEQAAQTLIRALDQIHGQTLHGQTPA